MYFSLICYNSNMNISFIGMCGAGKSHIGSLSAQAFGMDFVDIDREMEKESGQGLQLILDTLGDEKFLQQQEKQILDLADRDNLVVSPGGSVVYSKQAMHWLATNTIVVYLQVPHEIIANRISASARGIVGLGS